MLRPVCEMNKDPIVVPPPVVVVAHRFKSVRKPDKGIGETKMNSLAEMAVQNISVENLQAELDKAEEQIGQDVLFLDEEWLAEKVEVLNYCQELLDRAMPEQLETPMFKGLERAVDILKRDYLVSVKVYNDPKLREALKTVGWRWAKFVS